ncbi:hypothetical protein [Nocardia sp. NRRL S-836]|uniref:hypothetical protein n=1 Tax=Nocardia sp. NRRL S-836 TaxID=1519492 RepID=UPI0006C6C36B|nr:hypothetical protein [Nocardia sp. NRRL S-836]KOV87606.1 hypothetical protein ADL03_06855 [Nocardia sp. NRRL S-836]
MKVDPVTAINGKDFVAAKLDAMKILLSIVAGGGALFALYLAVRRQRTTERICVRGSMPRRTPRTASTCAVNVGAMAALSTVSMPR